MKLRKRIAKYILYFFLILISYFLISLLLSSITIDRKASDQPCDKTIFLSTNGVHLDIVIPISNIDSSLLTGLKQEASDNYLSFGWGDENFYLNTPTWSDLTFKNAFSAIFLNSSSLMHITRYSTKVPDWIEIKITEKELNELNTYIQGTFRTNDEGMKIILEDQGYTATDDFYKAKGSYSCFKTCNTWVNAAFKESGLKSCLWTPFDFGLMNKYQ